MAMVFPSSPTVGQVFTSAGRSWIWNGSTWDAPSAATAALSGLTLITSQSFTGQGTVSVNNVFSSTYSNYEVYISFLGTSNVGCSIRLRASGVDHATNSYHWNQIVRVDTTVSDQAQNATNFWELNAARTTGARNVTKLTMFAPARASVTKSMLGHAQDFTGTAIVSRNTVGYNSSGLVFDGFTIIPGSGTITGEIQVYGMRNS